MQDGRVAALLDEFDLTADSPEASSVLAEVLDRGIVSPDHFRRTFDSLRAASALPPVVDAKFVRHFGHWLEVINQPYFKPIITSPHRLDALIELLACNPYLDVTRRGITVVDVGTGHPPYTTVNLAERLSHATVYGFDLYKPAYLVRRASGEYALFADNDRLVSVHAPTLPQMHEMVVNWSRTSEAFTAALHALRTGPGGHGNGADGCTIVRQPTVAMQRRCRNRKLQFFVNERGGFELAPVPAGGVDVIWSFNCLLHYGLRERQEALQTLAVHLRDGGIVFEGYTSPRGAHAVLSVWQRDGERLCMREFAFSRANLGFPLWPLHGRDPQIDLLNRLLALLKQPGGVTGDEPAWVLAEHLNRHGYRCQPRGDAFLLVRPGSLRTQQDFLELPIAVPVGEDMELVWVTA